MLPGRQVVVRIRLLVPENPSKHRRAPPGVRNEDSRFDVCCGWEIFRVAPNVDCVLRLIHTHVVDAHGAGELQVLEVDSSKVVGDGQVHDDVLE